MALDLIDLVLLPIKEKQLQKSSKRGSYMPVRELYWNVEGTNLLYLFFAITLLIFTYGCYKKYNFWQSVGQPEERKEPIGERVKLAIVNSLGHQRIFKESFAGTMHGFIFYGFVILFIGTCLIMLEKYLGIPIVSTGFFLYFKLLLDIAGLLVLIGIIMAMYRRFLVKPQGIDTQKDDTISLILILTIILTGFSLTGMRLAVEPGQWLAFTPISAVVAQIFAAMFDSGTLLILHKATWWIHMLLAFAFIAYIPYSKLFHIIATTANQYWQNLQPQGALQPINFEDESIESFGINKVEDFSWKHLFDTEACIRCGRCQDNCPAFQTGKPLSPKQLIQDLGDHLQEKHPSIIAAQQQAGDEGHDQVAATVEEAQDGKELIGDVLEHEVIWSCTTCGSCQEQCPAYIEHVPKIIELRRNLVLDEGDVSPEAQKALTNMERLGNPWGIGKSTRIDWSKGLNVSTLAENENPQYVYWVGCAGAFDARNQKVTAAMVKVLQTAGVNFSIIGNEEMCCGESARRLGNEYLYQSLAEGNIELLKELGVKKIFTHCPHCFNTLKNEYPQFGADFQVIHHSQLLLELIKDNKLQLKKPMATSITYHDSCYLGRYNDIYQHPREIIKSIPQASLKEMGRHGGKSFCCGAGGGRMWMEETIGERINEVRAAEAIESGANIIATGCPYCLTMMDDGVKAKQQEEQVQIQDLAEIVAKSLE